MLGGIVQNIQEDLLHARRVTGDFGDIVVIFQIVQHNALLPQPGAVHEYGVLKLRAQVARHDVQGKAAVLKAGELQQLLDHVRQAGGLALDDAQAAAGLSAVNASSGGQQRFAPAADGCERGAQLMRDGRDELGLHFLCAADLFRHFVDGVRQLADLVVGLPRDLHAIAAGGDALGRGGQLLHRDKDGFDKVAAADIDNEQHDQADKRGAQAEEHDLPVGAAQARDIAKHADDLAVRIDERAGDCHDALTGRGICSGVGRDGLRLNGLADVGRHTGHTGVHAVGRGDDAVVRVDELQLHLVLRVKALGEFCAGLVIFVVALADVVVEKARARSRFGLHPGLHAGVVIGCDHDRKRDHAEKHDGKQNAQRIAQPALLQAAVSFHGGSSRAYRPHL